MYEQPSEQKNKRNARLHKKAAESAENISGMKRKRKHIKMTFPPIFLRWFGENRFGCPRIARVISSEELGSMSKNNLRRITLVRGPIWGIHSLTLIISWYKWFWKFSKLHEPLGECNLRIWLFSSNNIYFCKCLKADEKKKFRGRANFGKIKFGSLPFSQNVSWYKPVTLNELNCSCFCDVIRILLTDLIQSVWENCDLRRVYRPHNVWSVLEITFTCCYVRFRCFRDRVRHVLDVLLYLLCFIKPPVLNTACHVIAKTQGYLLVYIWDSLTKFQAGGGGRGCFKKHALC